MYWNKCFLCNGITITTKCPVFYKMGMAYVCEHCWNNGVTITHCTTFQAQRPSNFFILRQEAGEGGEEEAEGISIKPL